MAAIEERGRLIVGVDQNTFMFGFRDPSSGQLAGFDIDLAREIARRIFGDPDRIDLQVVDAGQRETALQSGQVDLVVRTFSITCARKEKVDFSTVYFYANQRILASKASRIDSAAALSGKRVCAVIGTTSLTRVYELEPKPTLIGATNWTDCLLMLQQAQVDAISTDDVVLFGLAAQDPNVHVVGPSLGIEPYGVGVKKGNDDLVRFVNGALAQIRADGTWERLYDDVASQPRTLTGSTRSEVSGLTMNILTLHRNRPRTRLVDTASRRFVDDADRLRQPPGPRTRAAVSADRCDRRSGGPSSRRRWGNCGTTLPL